MSLSMVYALAEAVVAAHQGGLRASPPQVDSSPAILSVGVTDGFDSCLIRQLGEEFQALRQGRLVPDYEA